MTKATPASPKKVGKSPSSSINPALKHSSAKSKARASKSDKTNWGSDLEIIEGPVPSPVKKLAPGARPVPGSPEFNSLDPVSITNAITLALRAAAGSPSLEFGTTSDDETTAEVPEKAVAKGKKTLRQSPRKNTAKSDIGTSVPDPTTAHEFASLLKSPIEIENRSVVEASSPASRVEEPNVRPKRRVTRTEKGTYADSLSPSRPSVKRRRSSTKQVRLAQKNDQEHSKGDVKECYSRLNSPAESESELPSKRRLVRKGTPMRTVIISDDEDHNPTAVISDGEDREPTANTSEDEDFPMSVSVADALKAIGKGKDETHLPPSDSKRVGNPFIDTEADDSSQDTAGDSSAEEKGLSGSEGEASDTGAGSFTHESVALDVTLKESLQDPRFRRLYEGLPVLTNICQVAPFVGLQTDIMSSEFHKLEAGCYPIDLKSIITALAFTSAPDYVNTARIDPSLLYMDNTRSIPGVRFTASKKIANLIMTGSIMECHINAVGKSGPTMNPYPIHDIVLAPFGQEWVRDTSVWGTVMGFDSINSTVSACGVQLTSKRPQDEGFTDSPRKPVASAFASPMKLPMSASSREPWQYARAFSDRVPIYDGRVASGHPFKFTNEHFGQLTSWPLWRNGDYDLPVDSVVSAGYTLNTYRGGSGKICLSINLQFVILLALPTSYEDPTSIPSTVPSTSTPKRSKRL